MTFKAGGFNTWYAYTTANVGKQTAFTLDGQVLSAPSIRQADHHHHHRGLRLLQPEQRDRRWPTR